MVFRCATLLAVLFCALPPVSAQTERSVQTAPPPEKLLDVMVDTVGMPIRYPEGAPRVSSYLLTMVPGQVTGWHRHDVPLYARILSGSIMVDYGAQGKKTYRAGDTFMEATGIWHNGHVAGDTAAKLLIVFMGAEGAKNTEMRTAK